MRLMRLSRMAAQNNMANLGKSRRFYSYKQSTDRKLAPFIKRGWSFVGEEGMRLHEPRQSDRVELDGEEFGSLIVRLLNFLLSGFGVFYIFFLSTVSPQKETAKDY